MKSLLLGTPAEALVRRLLGRPEFDSSEQYWNDRYRSARGHSGSGSYGRLARFKADVLNEFVEEMAVRDVVELGCGDGHQLSLADYDTYRGFDISPDALDRCRRRFAGDPSKSFHEMASLRPAEHMADLALSLDVIYHLVENETYEEYLESLFDSARHFVAVYSSNGRIVGSSDRPHVRHRRFTDWVARRRPEWELFRTVDNAYPFDPERPDETSVSDFYFFRDRSATG